MVECISKFRIWAFLGPLFFIHMVGGDHPISFAEEKSPPNKCNIHETACVKNLPDCVVSLDITPKPVKAMTDLNFIVILTGERPSAQPYIDLGMPGMNMGPNQVKLISVGDNVYQGKGVIVRCPSGRKTWQAFVTIPDIGIAEFTFDVVH
jgi:hypothetical protein